MKSTLKLDSYLTPDGRIKTEKSVLKEYYKSLSKGRTKRDKEAGIKIDLVLYPKFFSGKRSEKVSSEENKFESSIDIAARIQNAPPEAIKILHMSQGSIAIKDFSEKVFEISKM